MRKLVPAQLTPVAWFSASQVGLGVGHILYSWLPAWGLALRSLEVIQWN